MTNDPIIYHDPVSESRTPERGDILVASPFMNEDIFAHSVILILDAGSAGGCMGLVLNKRGGLTLQSIFPELSVLPPIEVYCGGPVGHDRLFMLHSLPEVFGYIYEVAPGLYVGGETDKIIDYVLEGGELQGKVRFFIGYSGWNDGQLSAELHNHAWTMVPPRDIESLISGEGKSFWRHTVESLGRSYRDWLTVPRDPSLN
ncbi:MAG: YqgE/AlgH family protein [Bacteroidales bacterium]|nr:YqgE/AlgH family protein [Bacteroidales bacterium]